MVAGCATRPDTRGADDKAARKLLAQWSGRPADHPFIPLDDAITLVGTWEPAIAVENDFLLRAGLLNVGDYFKGYALDPGTVRWADGTTRTIPLLNPNEAFERMVDIGLVGGGCGADLPCRNDRLVLERPRLETATVSTSLGPATVPVWSFPVRGSKVRVRRLAVRTPDAPSPAPPTSLVELTVRAAVVGADGRTLRVMFDGSTCDLPYHARAVESDRAVVVIAALDLSTDHKDHPCFDDGRPMIATATLAAPLGDRVVLDLRTRRPVTMPTG